MADSPEIEDLHALPLAALDMPVSGVGLSPGTLRDQLDEGLTLLVFLRHFGCIFCRETVHDLRVAAETDSRFPNVLFFSQGAPTELRAFLRRYWPGARAIADPQLEFYEMFGIRRAGVLEGLGPRVLASRKRAQSKGLTNGPRSGDVWRMPGLFAVEGHRIVWSYQFSHAADHPDFMLLPELISAEQDQVSRGELAAPTAKGLGARPHDF